MAAVLACAICLCSCSSDNESESQIQEVADPAELFTINTLDNYTYVSTVTAADQSTEVVECTVFGTVLGFHGVEAGRDAWVIKDITGDFIVVSRIMESYKYITQKEFLGVVSTSKSALFPFLRTYDLDSKEALPDGVKVPFEGGYAVFDYNGNLLYDVIDIYTITYQFQEELNLDLVRIPEGYTEE